MGDGTQLECAMANVRMRERNGKRLEGIDQYALAKELHELNVAAMRVLLMMGEVSVPESVAQLLGELNLRTKRIWEAGHYQSSPRRDDGDRNG